MYIFPIERNKVVFESYSGRQISCNPLSIYQYLSAKDSKLKLVWSITPDCKIPEGMKVQTVIRNTLKYVYTIMTAHVYVTNGSYLTHIPFRRKQFIINTWHGGGAYKRNKEDDSCVSNLQKKIGKWMLEKEIRDASFFISSSVAFSDLICEDVGYSRKQLLEIGMPRNDIFFDRIQMENISCKVRDCLGLDQDTFCILYAPTYRKSYTNPAFNMELNINLLLECVCERFSLNKAILLYRGHNSFSKLSSSSFFEEKMFLDVSTYPNMQDLLCAADMLISDYSSCIWDFSFTYRPCILFVPDVDEYNKDRGFYTPIEEWGFPIAKSNVELTSVIQEFDQMKFNETMVRHHRMLGSFEKGNATEKVSNIILSKLY